MPRRAKTTWIDRFAGYSDVVNPGDDAKLTADLNNVHIRFGRVVGRGGMTNHDSISSASSADIIGLFNYRQADGGHELVRMLPTKLEWLTGGAWADRTGTALTGTATTRPQYTIIDDTLVFTNGVDLPRKFIATAANSASIASGLSPYAKGCIAYYGFLFLTNVSDNGTFTDVFDGHRIGRYSDAWDTDWSACEGNEITLDETPGSWDASLQVGKSLFALKSDGAVKITWVGGNVKFRQDLVPSDVGIVAPLSAVVAGSSLGFFLGTDGIVYQVTEQGISPISYEALCNLLPNTASLNKLKYARGMIDSKNDSYILFYDRTGLANQLLDSYVEFNYRTKEWVKGTLGKNIISCTAYKSSDQAAEKLCVSTATLVNDFDSTATTDDGTTFKRYWTSGWQKLQEQGWFHGCRINFDKNGASQVRISVARDFSQRFSFPQTFTLRGGLPGDDEVEVTYRVPPVCTEWLNVKVEFIHNGTSASSNMRRVGFEITPLIDTGEVVDRGQNAIKAAI